MSIKVAFFDCDGTLTKVKSSWEYIHRRLGIWNDGADEYQGLFRQGLIGYVEFCRRDALLWKGLALADILAIANQIPYQQGSREAVASLKRLGIYTVIISTGLSFLVDRVRGDLGIDRSLSNEVVSEGGFLNGEIKINVGFDQKGVWVRKVLDELGFGPSEACAVGDGEGDRGMFEAVGLSIGFNPHLSVKPFLSCCVEGGSLLGIVDTIRRWT